ncbi:hypothetical protein [Allokutzneria albata]|uniref:DUF5666 domain-containing protein n=1 Tax=Allokutzneria albata TaxID=211114 RepID=A0A1G9VV09_ALLAB|nr:hypothetical protein [Allokutzneria albata]SDM76089.1 hypothetical protein SAMN04489726_3252 [Allokutzneria albata]
MDNQAQSRKRRAVLGAGIVLTLSLGTVGGIALAQGSDPVAVHAEAKPGKHEKAKRPVAIGTVAAVGQGTLKITKDGGGELSLTTDNATKVRGMRTLGDFKAGQRVTVTHKDGKALAVVLTRAHAKGTVTALNGQRATLVTAGGLAQTLDLTAVTEKPKVGDVVAATGTAVESGAVLKVERLRQLPK